MASFLTPTRRIELTLAHKAERQKRFADRIKAILLQALGQGFASEAVNALTRYAFQRLKARRLAIHCDSDNHKSKAIPERLGFELEGVLRNHLLKVSSKALRDTHIYSRIDLRGLPPLKVQW